MRENGNFQRHKCKPDWRSRTVRTLDRSTEDGPVETVQSDVRPRSEHQRKWNLESGTSQENIINTRVNFLSGLRPSLLLGKFRFFKTLIGKPWKTHPEFLSAYKLTSNITQYDS